MGPYVKLYLVGIIEKHGEDFRWAGMCLLCIAFICAFDGLESAAPYCLLLGGIFFFLYVSVVILRFVWREDVKRYRALRQGLLHLPPREIQNRLHVIEPSPKNTAGI